MKKKSLYPERDDTKSNYESLLHSPKWQRKRLEIMQRDEWKCRVCGDTERELHVHHIKYSGKNPWDAKNEDLITLCDECHTQSHALKKLYEEIYSQIIDSLSIYTNGEEPKTIIEYIEAVIKFLNEKIDEIKAGKYPKEAKHDKEPVEFF
jgi:hypothetical protein